MSIISKMSRRNCDQDPGGGSIAVPLIIKNLADGNFSSHFCYHPMLSISGSCRICVLEASQTSKPLTTCTHESKILAHKIEEPSLMVHICSTFTRKSKEGISEFLLCNHPTDCPLCTQSGNCDLQDQSDLFESPCNRFNEDKRGLRNKLTPSEMHVKTSMLKCIHCGRCERFGSEIAGIDGLGFIGRGSSGQIGTYLPKLLTSELSGNLAELCPVGSFFDTFSHMFLNISSPIPVVGGFIIIYKIRFNPFSFKAMFLAVIGFLLPLALYIKLAGRKKKPLKKYPARFRGKLRPAPTIGLKPAVKPKPIPVPTPALEPLPVPTPKPRRKMKSHVSVLISPTKGTPKRAMIRRSTKSVYRKQFHPAKQQKVLRKNRLKRLGRSVDERLRSRPTTTFVGARAMTRYKTFSRTKKLRRPQSLRLDFVKRRFCQTNLRRRFRMRAIASYATSLLQMDQELGKTLPFRAYHYRYGVGPACKVNKEKRKFLIDFAALKLIMKKLDELPMDSFKLTQLTMSQVCRFTRVVRFIVRREKLLLPGETEPSKILLNMLAGDRKHVYYGQCIKQSFIEQFESQRHTIRLTNKNRRKVLAKIRNFYYFPLNSPAYPDFQEQNPYKPLLESEEPLTIKVSTKSGTKIFRSFFRKSDFTRTKYFGVFERQNLVSRALRSWHHSEMLQLNKSRVERFLFKLWSSKVGQYAETLLPQPFKPPGGWIKDWYEPGPDFKGLCKIYEYWDRRVYVKWWKSTRVDFYNPKDYPGSLGLAAPGYLPMDPAERLRQVKSFKNTRRWNTPEEPRFRRYLRIHNNKLFWIPGPGQKSNGGGQLTAQWHPGTVRRKPDWLPGFSKERRAFVLPSDLERRWRRRHRFKEHPSLNTDYSPKGSIREPQDRGWESLPRLHGWSWRGWSWSDWKHKRVLPKSEREEPFFWTLANERRYRRWSRYVKSITWQRLRAREHNIPFMDQFNHSTMHLEKTALEDSSGDTYSYSLYVTQQVFVGKVHIKHIEKVVERHLKVEHNCLIGNVSFASHHSFAELIRAPMDSTLSWHPVTATVPETLLLQVTCKRTPVSNELAIAIKGLLNEIRDDFLTEGRPYKQANDLIPDNGTLDILTQVPTVLREGATVPTLISNLAGALRYIECFLEDLLGWKGTGHFTFPFTSKRGFPNRFKGGILKPTGREIDRDVLKHHKWVQYFGEEYAKQIPEELPPKKRRLFPDADFGKGSVGKWTNIKLNEIDDAYDDLQDAAADAYDTVSYFISLFRPPRK